jgi:hypothetical protein
MMILKKWTRSFWIKKQKQDQIEYVKLILKEFIYHSFNSILTMDHQCILNVSKYLRIIIILR